MPIHSCQLPDGSSGYKWGGEGKCYLDRADAEKQAQAAYANGYTGDSGTHSVAMDQSVRRIDQDGHLHVELSNISKANVCGYFGCEIPDADKHGLKPDQLYQLYRHPDALKKAAETFNGKPLLIVHKPQTADEHDHRLVVGSVHNVNFDDPYLTAELVVWDGDAIKLIESGEQRELSCGYYYRFVPEPGVANGSPYDGYMTDIVGNHVALVTEGRAGHDVFVGDGKPELPPDVSTEAIAQPQEKRMAVRHAALSKQALLASGALRAYLRPKLAADAKLDLTPILLPITAANWQEQKPQIKAALDSALAGKLAKDAEISDIIDILEELDDAVGAEEMGADEKDDDDDDDDEEEKKRKAKKAAENLKEAAEDEKDDDDDPKLRPNMPKAKDEKDDDDDDDKKSASDEKDDDDDDDDDDKKARDRKGAKDRRGAKDRKGAKDKAKGMDQQPMITKAAMDAAIATAVGLAAKKAAQEAEASTIARLRAIAEAEKAVRPYIGEIAVAQDSAAAVYRIALDAAGVDLAGIPEAAFPAMVKLLPLPGERQQQTAKAQRVAMDAAAVDRRNQMFPNANRLLRN